VKGLVERRRRGKVFVFHSRVARGVVEVARARVALSKLFGAPPKEAVATLVDAMESLDPALVDELGRIVSARRGMRDGS
jgi:predicted transcriptional regulator